MKDLQYGRVRVARWSNFHFKYSPERFVEVVQVEVVKSVGRQRKFQVLRLTWLGQTRPPLQEIWRYLSPHWYSD